MLKIIFVMKVNFCAGDNKYRDTNVTIESEFKNVMEFQKVSGIDK